MQQRQSTGSSDLVSQFLKAEFKGMGPDDFLKAVSAYRDRDPEFCLNRIEEYLFAKSQDYFSMMAKSHLNQGDQFNIMILEAQLDKLNQKSIEIHDMLLNGRRFERVAGLDLEDVNNMQIEDAYQDLQKAKAFFSGISQTPAVQSMINKIDNRLEEVGTSYLMSTTEKERKALFGDKFDYFEDKLNTISDQYSRSPSGPSV